MATITREQVNKLNAECKNGFIFDITSFILHSGEKQFSKTIKTGENTYLIATIMFYESYNRQNRITVKNPTLHFAEYTKRGEVGVSHGIGYFVTVGEPVKRKNTKTLVELTERYTEETLLKMYEEQKATKVNMYA